MKAHSLNTVLLQVRKLFFTPIAPDNNTNNVSGYSERTPLQSQQNTLNEYPHHILFYLLPIAFQVLNQLLIYVNKQALVYFALV